MNEETDSLWQASPAWRGMVLLAGVLLALGLLGAPWHSLRQAGAPPTAGAPSYQPQSSGQPLPAAPAAPTMAVAPPPSAAQSDQIDANSRIAASTFTIVQVPPPTAAESRHSSSGVVWSSEHGRMPGPSVSGGGLILFNPSGGTSTGYASRGVAGGRHYWELTLSTQPGEPLPQTWSAAGVVPRGAMKDEHRLIIAGVGRDNGGLVVPVGRDRTIRGGDVMMFALDADQKIAWWGVNGQWRNGIPGGAGGTALEVRPGEQFIPFGNVSGPKDRNDPEGDRWIANFGGSKFRYPVPSRFDAYGTTGGAAQLAPASPVPQAARQASPDSLMGKQVDGVVEVSGQRVPLPKGRWTVLAHFKGNAARPGDALLLGQLEGKTVRKLVAVNAARTPRPGTQPTFRSCLRQDVFFQSNDAGRADAPRCWWVNHAVGVWNEPLFKAAQAELEQRGIQPSAVYLNVGFYRSDQDGYATAFYYFDPAEADIASKAVAWDQSEWHRSRIDADPQRAAYARKTADWGRDWAPIYFASK